MEEIKYYIFYRENNNFDDILNDMNLKKMFSIKIFWSQYLLVGSEKMTDELYSYILLKYGDDLKNVKDIIPDRKPIPFVDYIPEKNRPEKFKKL